MEDFFFGSDGGAWIDSLVAFRTTEYMVARLEIIIILVHQAKAIIFLVEFRNFGIDLIN